MFIRLLITVMVVAGIPLSLLAFSPPEIPDRRPADYVSAVGILETGKMNKVTGVVEYSEHGSGVFISPTHFLSAAHVVANMVVGTESRIRMENGDIYDISGGDSEGTKDIGTVITRNAYKGHIPAVNCDIQPRAAELITFGSPLTLEFALIKIMVTGASPDAKRMAGGGMEGLVFFQGVALPGQSGSPIYNQAGDVVGVLVMTIVNQNNGSYTGIGIYNSINSVCKWVTDRV